jgi:hypothetical protein
MRRKDSWAILREAMTLLGQESFVRWVAHAPPMPPSQHLVEALLRLETFDLENSEAAKLLLLDTLFAEIVSRYPTLKVWKSAPLESDVLSGVADYLITPKREYLASPLLCVAEAKKDDFAQGRAQCLSEIAACLWNNAQEGIEIDLYGIVSNGQVWQFYRRLITTGEIGETELFTVSDLPPLLTMLDVVCGACADNVATLRSHAKTP